MALQLFECLEDCNVNGDPHLKGDRLQMTQEQVERFDLVGKVQVVEETPAPAEPAPEN